MFELRRQGKNRSIRWENTCQVDIQGQVHMSACMFDCDRKSGISQVWKKELE